MSRSPLPCLAAGFLFCCGSLALAAEPQASDRHVGDRALAKYFQTETMRLAEVGLDGIKTLDDWQSQRPEHRRQLLEMLGLDPLPERTDLKPVVTGQFEHDGIVVEKLHFQSRPGLYVTANLYRPQTSDKRLPAVLYVCGHGQVKKNGVSYGNKTHYQHHGYWLAKHGYVCLVIDTLQLGEIEGIHHGTHRYNMWWWLNRGYTPAGVEAWNCVRALDYLQSRKEVDGERLGVTGRSGGGAYSWWIAAIDGRVQCAVPTAGITTMQNHVVDGVVEGHCDCMFMVNTYRWDYPQVAAMVAPRPLLIANTDSDPIFPLDGVVRTFQRARHIYTLHNAKPKIGLNITAGGHVDTQELQVHALRWLDLHLKGKSELLTDAAVKPFEVEQLKVFDSLPTDEINTKIHETFVPPAPPAAVPADAAEWTKLRDAWRQQLTDKSFRAWPRDAEEPKLRIVSKPGDDARIRAFTFAGESFDGLSLLVVAPSDVKQVERCVLHVLGADQWPLRLPRDAENAKTSTTAHFFFAPRGIGPTAFDTTEKKQVQNRRRFYLLGQTLDGMQAWDVCRALQAIRNGLPEMQELKDVPLEVEAQGSMAGIALYATLFEAPVDRLTLTELPASHRDGPYFLNVQRILDMPQAVALAAERTPVTLVGADAEAWEYPQAVAKKLGWQNRLRLEPATAEAAGK